MSKAFSGDYSLPPNQLSIALQALIGANQPTMVWGPPGIGKSDVARQVADNLNMRYIDVRALLLDPVDLRGIPWRDEDDRTRWAPPIFLPPTDSDEMWLINLDELSSAPPMVQAALYQLVLDRQVGEYVLPAGARLMACGNRESDRGVVYRMPSPLASRFVHLDAKVDIDAWMDWALEANLAVEVIFFLKYRPELLMNFDPKSAEKAFPCPRTWAFVGNLVDAGNRGTTAVDLAIIKGAIGEGSAVEFAAFLEVYKNMPAPESIFDDPQNAPIPDEPSTMIALCGALCRMAEDHRMDALVAYTKRSDMRPEIGEFLIGSSVKFHPTSRYTKAYIAWQAHMNAL